MKRTALKLARDEKLFKNKFLVFSITLIKRGFSSKAVSWPGHKNFCRVFKGREKQTL
jgi:hypothetical protein